jgi:hypothetical protein
MVVSQVSSLKSLHGPKKKLTDFGQLLGFRVSKSWPKLTDFGQLLWGKMAKLTGKKLAEIRCCRK